MSAEVWTQFFTHKLSNAFRREAEGNKKTKQKQNLLRVLSELLLAARKRRHVFSVFFSPLNLEATIVSDSVCLEWTCFHATRLIMLWVHIRFTFASENKLCRRITKSLMFTRTRYRIRRFDIEMLPNRLKFRPGDSVQTFRITIIEALKCRSNGKLMLGRKVTEKTNINEKSRSPLRKRPLTYQYGSLTHWRSIGILISQKLERKS